MLLLTVGIWGVCVPTSFTGDLPSLASRLLFTATLRAGNLGFLLSGPVSLLWLSWVTRHSSWEGQTFLHCCFGPLVWVNVEGDRTVRNHPPPPLQNDRGILNLGPRSYGCVPDMFCLLPPGAPKKEVYFMAIIDILTPYDAKKKAAHAAKTVKHGVSEFPSPQVQASAVRLHPMRWEWTRALLPRRVGEQPPIHPPAFPSAACFSTSAQPGQVINTTYFSLELSGLWAQAASCFPWGLLGVLCILWDSQE